MNSSHHKSSKHSSDSDRAVSRALLEQTSKLLTEVLGFEHPADAVISRYFRENRQLGHRDRAFIAENIYAVLRRLRWLSALCGADKSARSLLLTWLVRGAGWSIKRFEGLVSAAELTWLADVKARTFEARTPGEATDLPDWFANSLLAQYGEAGLFDIAAGLNQAAPLDLRANPLKTDRDKLLLGLSEAGVTAQACRFSPLGVRLATKPALQRHALFLGGHFEVQDEGSQLLSYLVQPRRGELVVDFCAGAGGKTLALGGLMRSTGRLYALDVSDKRLSKLKPRAARAGLSNIHPTLIAHERDSKLKRMAGKADRVLVDAPCSGLGTLRRNPDLKWRQSRDSVTEMSAKQLAILSAAARLVKPGGRLVYATCSLLNEENQEVVSAFLAANPEFSSLSAESILHEQGIELACGDTLSLMPHLHDTDGFFAAVLQRRVPG